MIWYENQIKVSGVETTITGTYHENNQMLSINYEFELGGHTIFACAWNKMVNMWAHQDILAEDILAKHLGRIKKIEQKLPYLVEQERLRQRI